MQKTLKRIRESFIAVTLRDNSIAFTEVILLTDMLSSSLENWKSQKSCYFIESEKYRRMLLALSAATHYWSIRFPTGYLLTP